MPAPYVRAAVPADAAAIAALQVRSWRVAYRGLVPDDFLDRLTEDAWLARWQQMLASPRAGIHHLVSCDGDGAVVAVAGCGEAPEPSGRATGQLFVIYADPAVWGQGHGHALLEEVRDRLAADGHAAALLWVAARNARTIRWYEAHGWSLDGVTQTEEVAGAVFDETRMVRELV